MEPLIVNEKYPEGYLKDYYAKLPRPATTMELIQAEQMGIPIWTISPVGMEDYQYLMNYALLSGSDHAPQPIKPESERTGEDVEGFADYGGAGWEVPWWYQGELPADITEKYPDGIPYEEPPKVIYNQDQIGIGGIAGAIGGEEIGELPVGTGGGSGGTAIGILMGVAAIGLILGGLKL